MTADVDRFTLYIFTAAIDSIPRPRQASMIKPNGCRDSVTNLVRPLVHPSTHSRLVFVLAVDRTLRPSKGLEYDRDLASLTRRPRRLERELDQPLDRRRATLQIRRYELLSAASCADASGSRSGLGSRGGDDGW